jgi:DnaJ domain
MPPNQHIRPQDRAHLLLKWLRKHLADELIFQFLQAVLFGLIGLALVAFISAPLLYCLLFVPGLRAAQILCIVTLLLLVQAILFKRAYDTRYELANLSSELAFVYSLLIAGPGMVIIAMESLEKSFQLFRLLHYDLFQVARVFVWLSDRGKKATVEEVCLGLLGRDAVRILSKLGYIPGVIWPTDQHGVILLSHEMHLRLAELLKKTPPKFEPEEPPPREQEIPFNREYFGDVEAVNWYVDLNLPPFTPLPAVKRRYRQLAKIHHPDAAAARKNGAAPASDEPFKRINAAYHNILKNSQNK